MDNEFSLEKIGIFHSDQIIRLKRNSIRNQIDLLYYFPRSYVDRSVVMDFSNVKAGDTVTFIGKIVKLDTAFGKRRRLIVKVDYAGWVIHITFFSAIHYYRKIMTPHTWAVFSGKIDIFNGAVTMIHPAVEVFDSNEDEDFIHTGKIIPIYRVTDAMKKVNISNYKIREAVHYILQHSLKSLKDIAPQKLLKQFSLIDIKKAFHLIHYPENMQDVESARRRHAFDEMYRLIQWLIYRKREKENIPKARDLPNDSLKDRLLNALPFKLTNDQIKAINTIREIMFSNKRFNILMQGDVGSGKTLIALSIALTYIENGIQVAFMAPTEILARQHYQTILNLSKEFPLLKVDLLLGKEKASEKREKTQRIQRGDTLLVIGTHSLIQKTVEFYNLGLVIIDEEHRFGADQRNALEQKGNDPDVISMSATPIPRSLTLALYGDLDTIQIKEKPRNRKPIDTRIFSDESLHSLYKGVKKYVDQGRQAYIVYPIIEESDKTNWSSIEKDYFELENKLFSSYRIGLIHGRLTPAEKENAMQKFQEGLIQILVSTTVIEVGIDVPNATVIMIRNAEKFGLAQLHQLRGRVGRGEHQSFCILVTSSRITAEAKERLTAMIESNDGFYLAKKDLEIRGAGDLIKTQNIRQSGVSELKIADLQKDEEFIEPLYDFHSSQEDYKKPAKKWNNKKDFSFTFT